MQDNTNDLVLDLLRRWHAGDRQALAQLMAEVEPWLRQEVRMAMGGKPVNAQDSLDVTQQALLNFLETGPRFVPKTAAQFWALLRRIAMNELIDLARKGKHRDARRFGTLFGSATSAGFAGAAPSIESPTKAASFGEEWNWLRLALQYLDPDDRRILIASEVEEQSWAAIAVELSLPSADAARVRASRLKPRLASYIAKLKAGRTPEEQPLLPPTESSAL